MVGDIVMTIVGAGVGNVATVPSWLDGANITQTTARLSVDPERADPQFISAVFQSSVGRRSIELFAKGAAQPGLNLEHVRVFPVTLPPRDEQTKIAMFLDRETSKIDTLVGEQRRLIELLKEKREAVISHAVTKGLNPNDPLKPSGIEWLGEVPEHWMTTSVRNLIRRQALTMQDGNHGESHPKSSEYMPSGVPFLMAGDMGSAGIDLENCSFITEDRAARLRIGPALPGDVLLSTKGAQLGEVAIIPERIDFPFIVLTPQITYYRVMTSEIDRGFLAFVLESSVVQSQLWFHASIQATRPYVGLTAQRELFFALPPIDEQRAIRKSLETKIGKLDILTSEAERGIELLQERRAALISAAVTGKIDVCEFVSSQSSKSL